MCSACTEGQTPPAPICGRRSETCWLASSESKTEPHGSLPAGWGQDPCIRIQANGACGRKRPGKRESKEGKERVRAPHFPPAPEERRASTNKTHPRVAAGSPQASPPGSPTHPAGRRPAGGPARPCPAAPDGPGRPRDTGGRQGSAAPGRAGPGRAGASRGASGESPPSGSAAPPA